MKYRNGSAKKPLRPPVLHLFSAFCSLSTLLSILALFPTLSSATQSVYSCPLAPQIGFLGVLSSYGGLGEVCGTGSFFHYWTCCEDYPFECCFNLEPWAMVLIVALIVLMLAICLFSMVRFVLMRKELGGGGAEGYDYDGRA